MLKKGTVGGAVYQNAGCWGKELNEVLVQVDGFMPGAGAQTWKPADLHFAYRTSALREGKLKGGLVVEGDVVDVELQRRRQAHRVAVQIHLVNVETLRLQEQVMALAVGLVSVSVTVAAVSVTRWAFPLFQSIVSEAPELPLSNCVHATLPPKLA